MRIKRVLLAALAAVLASFAFSSCVNEAPEINYVVEYTHNSDFSSIIEAIKSQSSTIAQKLDAVEAAVSEGFMTMEEASGALKDALVESLNNQNATLSDIQQAIVSQNLLLEDKLDVLTAAVDNQTATLDEALEYIEVSLDNQTEALKAKLDLLAEIIETGAADLVDALEAFEETMDEAIGDLESTVDDGFGDVTQATNAQTTAMGIMTASIIRAINNGVTTLANALAAIEEAIDDQTEALEYELEVIKGAINSGVTTLANALAAIEEAIDDQTDEINLQAGLIINALDTGNASIAEVAEALSNIYDNITEFEPLLGDYYQNIYDAILLITAEEPEEEPLYYVKDNTPGLFMNAAGYKALENSSDVRAAYLSVMQQYAVDAPFIGYEGIYTFNSGMNHEGLLDHNSSVDGLEMTDDPNQSYIVYSVEDADAIAEGEGYKHVLYNEAMAKVSVTGRSSNISYAQQTTHTLIYSIDGGLTWSSKITYDTRDLLLAGGTAHYTAYIPVNGVTNIMFNYGE